MLPQSQLQAIEMVWQNPATQVEIRFNRVEVLQMEKDPRTKTVRGPEDYLLIDPAHPARHPAFDAPDRFQVTSPWCGSFHTRWLLYAASQLLPIG